MLNRKNDVRTGQMRLLLQIRPFLIWPGHVFASCQKQYGSRVGPPSPRYTVYQETPDTTSCQHNIKWIYCSGVAAGTYMSSIPTIHKDVMQDAPHLVT